MMEKMGLDPDKFNDVQKKGKKHKEGEVSIDSKPKSTKKGSTENLGEYVDFEEIDD
jgi:hypothetical protein